MATLYKGDVSVRETYDSQRIVCDDARHVTYILVGRYGDLKSIQPSKGDKYDGLDVISSELSRDRGDMGRLSIQCHGKKRETTVGTTAEPNEVVYEVDCAVVEKPLRAKPEYSPYGAVITLWEAAPADLRSQKKYVDEEGETRDLDGRAAEYAALVLAGVESYVVFAPVVRITSTYERRPDGIGKNMCKRGKPPASAIAGVSGTWEWLKNGDTRTYNAADDTWTRVETWQAADKWNDTLYGEAT